MGQKGTLHSEENAYLFLSTVTHTQVSPPPSPSSSMLPNNLDGATGLGSPLSPWGDVVRSERVLMKPMGAEQVPKPNFSFPDTQALVFPGSESPSPAVFPNTSII